MEQSELEALAAMIAGKLTPKDTSKDKPNDKPNDKPDAPTEHTPEAFAQAMMDVITKQNEESQSKLFGRMWQDKVTETCQDSPMFAEYLDGKDEYGNIRREQLDAVTDYDTRLERLQLLKSSFNEAQAGAPGRAPIVDKKAVKLAEENEKTYDDILDKASKGEFGDINQFSNAFFDAINQEMASIN